MENNLESKRSYLIYDFSLWKVRKWKKIINTYHLLIKKDVNHKNNIKTIKLSFLFRM